MRFKRIELSGFRAFAVPTSVDLDADCVIMSGANGQGKTSLLDGIFWALTGRIERLGDGDDRLVSLYSRTGGASVHLTMQAGAEELTILRRFDGQDTKLTCTLGGRTIGVSELRERFGYLVIESSSTRDKSSELMATALSRSLYLQQDSIRDFINTDSDDLRFRIVAELCGLGRVADLQVALQQERKAWTQATHQLESQLIAKRNRLAELRERANRLSEDDGTADKLILHWDSWWSEFSGLMPNAESAPDVGSTAADLALDRAVRLLDNLKLEAVRLRDSSAEALRIVGQAPRHHVPTAADQELLKEKAEQAVAAEEQSAAALRLAQAENVIAEKALLEHASIQEELRTLAQLALRHLTERCPVCAQAFDKTETTNRLTALLKGPITPVNSLQDLSPLIEHLTAAKGKRLAAVEAQQRAEADSLRSTQTRSELNRRLAQLGLPDTASIDEAAEKLTLLAAEVTDRLRMITNLRLKADQLSVLRARAGELAQRQEVEKQLMSAADEVRTAESVLDGRQKASRVASSISDEMQDASLAVVTRELRRVEPLLQRIWAGIDPHPSLRAVSLISKLSYAKGRLSMRLSDDSGGVSSDAPETVLSSSQLNALAVALFLTLNLGTQSVPVAATVLDDPFQSLDDINLLGLVDLLRRISTQRQLVLTTHEHRFAQLLARKMRPVGPARTTKLIEFDSWTAGTPLVTERFVSQESQPFKFAD